MKQVSVFMTGIVAINAKFSTLMNDLYFFFSGTAAKRFGALRKRFNKKRRSLIAGSRSGSGTGDVSELEASLKEYSFLTWLSPYVQPRKTKSNFPDDQRQKENDRL